MYKYLFLLLVIAAAACQPNQNRLASNEVSIEGKLNGFDTGQILLVDPLDKTAAADTIYIQHGKFSWHGTADSIKPIYLVIKDTPYDNGVHLFLEPGKVYIEGGRDKNDIVKLSGTPNNVKLDSLNTILDALSDPLEGYGNNYSRAVQQNDLATIDRLTKLYYEVSGKKRTALKKYLQEHGASYAAMFTMYNLYDYNPDGKSLEEVYALLSPELQATSMGRKLKVKLDGAVRTEIGSPAPDFTLNDIQGKPVTLSSFKGKYVLLDFWASWCVPCRFENKNLVKVYADYKDKGFEILSLSVDSDRDAWLKAIGEDKLVWKHVIDQKARESDVYKLYTVGGIPMNFLMDKEGKIVGKGLRGKDLEVLLQQIIREDSKL